MKESEERKQGKKIHKINSQPHISDEISMNITDTNGN
jgi:hypothetical protein